jgi:hypothetical protein
MDDLVLLRHVLSVLSRRMGLIVERHLMRRRMSVAGCALHTHLLRAMSLVRVVTVFVAHVTRRGMPLSRRRYRTKVRAAAEHLGAPVSMAIKVPLALTVRPRYPDIGAAADKHDIAVRGSRDIDVVGFRDDLFHHYRPYGHGRTRGRRTACDHAGSGWL